MELANQLEMIRSDLESFSDPASDVLVEDERAIWEQDGETRQIKIFRDQDQVLSVQFEGRHLSYRDFLACRQMANLKQLAHFILKTAEEIDPYIETTARMDEIDEAPETGDVSLVELIRERCQELPAFSTRVLFVRGEAGAGKTFALRRLSQLQAKQYLQGDTKTLFFYVDAQGRALSRFEDAISKELDDVRAKFTYEAASPLTRHGLLIPIIDGFDELLGSGGYDDAFSSLSAFISTLNGQGAVVASARSAFFDYTELRENAARYSSDGSLNYNAETIQVEEWDFSKIEQFFLEYGKKAGVEESVTRGQLRLIEKYWSEENKELLRKPFYASKVAEEVATTGELDLADGQDLLSHLVESFLQREVGKITDRDGYPLLSIEGHKEFIESIAEEMWWLENRKIDLATVQVLAELIADKRNLSPNVAKALVERVSSYAFLSSRGPKKMLGFEHEVFYGFFLAKRLTAYASTGGAELRRFLSRSVMEDPLIDQTARQLSRSESTAEIIANISSATSPALSDVVPRENAGSLAAALMRLESGVLADLTLRNLIVRGKVMTDLTIRNSSFTNCVLEEIDLTRSSILDSSVEGSMMRDVRVDPESTEFHGTSLKVGEVVLGLLVKDSVSDRYTKVYAPEAIAQVLLELGASVPGYEPAEAYSATTEEKIQALDRLLRVFDRQFYLAASELESWCSNRDQWTEIFESLDDHGLIDRTYIVKSGPKEPMLRLSVPPSVLRHGENLADPSVPLEVKNFWRDLTGTGQ